MSEWAIVIATAVGPLAAVLITLWYQKREQAYQRRLSVFRALMLWRRNWLHTDWVCALNSIPVEFSHNKEIISSFNSLIDRFNDGSFSSTGADLERAYNNAETVSIELLQKIAAAISIDLGSLDLRGRIYAPKGWADEQDAIHSLRQDSLKLLRGESRLRVDISNQVEEASPVNG